METKTKNHLLIIVRAITGTPIYGAQTNEDGEVAGAFRDGGSGALRIEWGRVHLEIWSPLCRGVAALDAVKPNPRLRPKLW